MVERGSKAQIRLALEGAARDASILLGPGHGFTPGEFSYGREPNVRPGGRFVRRERGSLSNGSYGFEVDADDVTAPLLAGKHGRRFQTWIMPSGESDGAEQLGFTAYATIVDSWAFADRARFQVALAADSAIDDTAAVEGPAAAARKVDYHGRQAQLRISTQTGELLVFTGGRTRHVSGGMTLTPATNYLEEPFGGQEYIGRVPLTEDGALAVETLHRGSAANALQEAAQAVARAEGCLAAIETPYGWYAGGLFVPELAINTPYDGVASYAGELPFSWDTARGARSGPWAFGPVVALAGVAGAAHTAVAPPAGWVPGDVYAAVTKSAKDEPATATLSQAGDVHSASFPLRTGIYRVLDAPGAITRLIPSASPAAPVDVTLIFGTRIQGQDAA